MYGKWLYKEIGTEYGACMVEIYRKNYTGESIEIGALAADSLSIALENLGSITDPIGKSVCSFSIIDTDQVEYDDFFTPDATALKVVVSTRVGSGAYVTRWSGYATPDFFAENLSYRTPISISARDNIGYLNDVDFDLTATTITVREFIQSAFNRIAEDYPMSLSFVTQKQTAEGILAIDAIISTTLLREMSWGEALETILHDLGLQMRWVDNNTIAVLDLSQIPEYYATQVFNFVDASGYREIVPAWRELSQEQNYGVRENFFEGWLREDNITFVKTENIRIPLSMGGVTGLVPMRYYTPNNWGVAGNTFVVNPKDYVYFGTYGQMAQPFGERIFFTGVEKDATNIANNYMSYRQDVYASNRPMRITFKAFTSVMATGGIGNNDALLAYDPANRFMDFATGDTLQLGLKVNLLLHVGTRTYILGQNWEEINGAETNSLYFVLPKIGQVDGSSVTPNEEEITIDVNTIPNDGVLELRIYGFTIHNKTNLQEDAGSATYDWLRMVSYINEVKYTYNIDNPDTGRYSQVEVNKQHNIKDTQSYTFGQIPVEGGAVNAFAGGLFKADGNELIGFQRNADATNYNLLELVGREIIHFNKKNYNRLSGTIRNLNKEPLMFNRLFVREGKKYAPYNYSLNVISNEMNITSMQEVEPYTTANFSEVHSEVSTGGATVSSGNNQVLQYSAEVGNAKRLYELQTISENEKPDAYVLVDGAGYPEARKLKLTDIARLDEKALEQYLVQYKYLQEADLTPIIQDFEKLEEAVNPLFGYFDANGNANNALKLGGHSADYFATADALNTHIKAFNNYKTATNKRLDDLEALWYMDDEGNVHTKHNIVVDKGGAFGMGAESGDVPSASVSIKFEGSNDIFSPVDGIITLPAYPSGGGGVADSVDWANVYNKPTTLGEYGITDALSVNGGVLKGSLQIGDNDNTSYLQVSVIRNNGLTYMATTGAGEGAFGTIFNNNTDTSIVLKRDNTVLFQDTNYNYHTLLHSGNYSSYALPLSGGTIENTAYGALVISRKGTNGFSAITYQNTADGILGYIGIGGSGSAYPYQPTLINNDGTFQIIHSGNIGSQSVNYASSAGNADTLGGYRADAMVKSYIDNTDRFTKFTDRAFFQAAYISGQGDFGSLVIPTWGGNNASVYYTAELRFNIDSANPKIRVTSPSGTSDWYTLARTVDNVASATKLSPTNHGNHITIVNSEWYSKKVLSTDWNSDLDDYTELNVPGSNVNTASLKLLENGNVLIGSDYDYGFKLQVNGNGRFRISSGNLILLETATNSINGGGIAFWSGEGWKNGTINASTLYLNNSTAGKVIVGSTLSGEHIEAYDFSSSKDDYYTENGKNIPWYGLSVYDAYNKGVWLSGYTSINLKTSSRYAKLDQTYFETNGKVRFIDKHVNIGAYMAPYADIRTELSLINGDDAESMFILGSAGQKTWGIESRASSENYRFSLYSWLGGEHVLQIDTIGHINISRSFRVGEGITAGGTVVCSDWFRSYGSTGWYSITYDGGIYMTDSVYLRAYNDKVFHTAGFTAGHSWHDQGRSTISLVNPTNNPVDFWLGTAGADIWSINVRATDENQYFGIYCPSYGQVVRLYKNGGMDLGGNLSVTGGGAFGSDIRYKDITSYRQLDLETIVNAPLFSFRWTDREDKVEHLGTSAQYWLGTQFKDAVNTANKDFFHLDYGALAVGIGISVAREVKEVKTEVQLLREKVNQLEQELAQYRRA